MRYARDHKQATRDRILTTAGRRFKRDGLDGAGVSALMSDAGLTNGAFYAHFDSKEHLVASVLADQLRTQRATLESAPPDSANLDGFVRAYLSPEHRDEPGDGCPSAALLNEIARLPEPVREVFTDELLATVQDVAVHLDPTDAETARVEALTLLGLMIGTLQLARALTDRDLSDQLLANAAETALELIDRKP